MLRWRRNKYLSKFSCHVISFNFYIIPSVVMYIIIYFRYLEMNDENEKMDSGSVQIIESKMVQLLSKLPQICPKTKKMTKSTQPNAPDKTKNVWKTIPAIFATKFLSWRMTRW